MYDERAPDAVLEAFDAELNALRRVLDEALRGSETPILCWN